jgi:hypothetical protein
MNNPPAVKFAHFPVFATYPRELTGQRTFAEIMDDWIPLTATRIRKHSIAFQDFPNVLQGGIMMVWERLAKGKHMFAHADK